MPQPGCLSRFVAKQAIEVVLADTAIGPAVLEQEAGQSRGHQAVLVPVGPGLDEGPHAIEQGLGDFRLQADALGRASRLNKGIGAGRWSAPLGQVHGIAGGKGGRNGRDHRQEGLGQEGLGQGGLVGPLRMGLGLVEAAVQVAYGLDGALGAPIQRAGA